MQTETIKRRSTVSKLPLRAASGHAGLRAAFEQRRKRRRRAALKKNALATITSKTSNKKISTTALAVGGVAAGAGAWLIDSRRRRETAQRLQQMAGGRGPAKAATGEFISPEGLNDADIAHKVETEVFRDAELPKGDININSEDGIVYLRGTVADEQVAQELIDQTAQVAGVRGVKNLLHTG